MISFIIKAALLISIYVFSIAELRAEGNCPPGYYPIGGQGVVGCAPIPGRNSQVAEPPPGQSKRSIRYTWGAIAGDQNRGIYGTAVGNFSRGTARFEAIEYCRGAGGVDCEVIHDYFNKCIAMSEPEGGGESAARREKVTISYQLGPDKKVLEDAALTVCEKENGRACKISYSACATPFHSGG